MRRDDMEHRDLRGPWMRARRVSAWAGSMLFLLFGSAVLSGERDLAYLLVGSSPFLLFFIFASGWMMSRWISLRDTPVPLPEIDPAQKQIKPEIPDTICTRHGAVT